MVVAKRTSKNQLTLPKAVVEQAVVEQAGVADSYDVICDQGRIVLTPLHPGGADAVRTRLAEPTARELLRVLAYPKFRLQAAAPTVCAIPTTRCFWIWPWRQPPLVALQHLALPHYCQRPPHLHKRHWFVTHFPNHQH